MRERRKFKKCCAVKGELPIAGHPDERRCLLDPAANAYGAIVHACDNSECIGEPQEWQTPETFESEEAAMTFYKTSIRPRLERLMAEASREVKDGTFLQRRLE